MPLETCYCITLILLSYSRQFYWLISGNYAPSNMLLYYLTFACTHDIFARHREVHAATQWVNHKSTLLSIFYIV